VREEPEGAPATERADRPPGVGEAGDGWRRWILSEYNHVCVPMAPRWMDTPATTTPTAHHTAGLTTIRVGRHSTSFPALRGSVKKKILALLRHILNNEHVITSVDHIPRRTA
jgi:hypothetical protein